MFLQKIESKYSKAKISCCNERCKIHVDRKHNFIMLKGELLVQSQPEKMCDCIIFQDNKKIALIELKTSSLDVSAILEKLVNSGKKSISIAKSCERHSDFDLFPILLAKNYSNYFAHDRLRRSRIKICGKKYVIILGKCGCALKDFVR